MDARRGGWTDAREGERSIGTDDVPRSYTAIPSNALRLILDAASHGVYRRPMRQTDGAVWRLVDTPPAPGAWNMAADEALAASVAGGGPPVLRVYRWSPACLSLGRNQPARGRYDVRALAERGIDVVRRPTGGRAVLHHRELTYAVAAPEALLGGPRRAYAAINAALVAGLRTLGVDATQQPDGPTAGAGSIPLPLLRRAAWRARWWPAGASWWAARSGAWAR